MLVAHLLALAAATSGVAARDFSVVPISNTLPAADGPQRLDTLDKRGYSDEEINAFGDWVNSYFDRPWDGNIFVGADYMHAQIYCDSNNQEGWYNGVKYVRYHFFCGAKFWTEKDSLSAPAGNYWAIDGGIEFS